jgi:DNA polymerase
VREVLRLLGSYLEQQLEFGEEEIVLASKDRSDRLESLKMRVDECMLCPLSKTRGKMVFGEGDADSSIVFVGEAPGGEENRQGRPFVGPAGQLLTKAIEAMGLRRDAVYIANIMKCRPPSNRVPKESEIASCLPYLLEQLSIIEPTVIGLLGAVATRSLLQINAPVFKTRGNVFSLDGMKAVPTYHPAALLRNPNLKKHFWRDINLIRDLGEPGSPE